MNEKDEGQNNEWFDEVAREYDKKHPPQQESPMPEKPKPNRRQWLKEALKLGGTTAAGAGAMRWADQPNQPYGNHLFYESGIRGLIRDIIASGVKSGLRPFPERNEDRYRMIDLMNQKMSEAKKAQYTHNLEPELINNLRELKLVCLRDDKALAAVAFNDSKSFPEIPSREENKNLQTLRENKAKITNLIQEGIDELIFILLERDRKQGR